MWGTTRLSFRFAVLLVGCLIVGFSWAQRRSSGIHTDESKMEFRLLPAPCLSLPIENTGGEPTPIQYVVDLLGTDGFLKACVRGTTIAPRGKSALTIGFPDHRLVGRPSLSLGYLGRYLP